MSTYATNTKTASKTEKYKNSNGTVMWSVTVKGTFTYTGSSSTCKSASVSTTCPSSSWNVSNPSASKSGNKAIASATGKNRGSGLSVTRKVTLTCSANGTLS